MTAAIDDDSLRDDLDEACARMASNARSHVDDAAVLIELGRWRGAYVLATFALEEIGKIWVLRAPGPAAERLKTFRKLSRDHAAKLAAAREFGAWVYQFAFGTDTSGRRVINLETIYDEGHVYEAELDHELRMAGSYVDVSDGLPIGGVEEVTEDAARRQFARAHLLGHRITGHLAAASAPATAVASSSASDPSAIRPGPR